jgi:hypothetical protein
MRSSALFAAAGLIAVFLPASTNAQTVVELRGRVIDSTTGQPVSQAIVRLPADRRYTLTSADGMFVLPDVPRGSTSIVVVHIAYGETTLRVDVQPDVIQVLRVAQQPIALAPVVVVASKFMDSRATERAHDVGQFGFWRKWERDAILASGIDQPIQFLKQKAKVGILKCSSLQLDPKKLCVAQPYDGGKMLQNASWAPRQLGAHNNPYWRNPNPPASGAARVYLDERPLNGLEALEAYHMRDVYRVETYGFKGELGIYLYSSGFLRLVEAGLVPRSVRAPRIVEAFEFPPTLMDSLRRPRRFRSAAVALK